MTREELEDQIRAAKNVVELCAIGFAPRMETALAQLAAERDAALKAWSEVHAERDAAIKRAEEVERDRDAAASALKEAYLANEVLRERLKHPEPEWCKEFDIKAQRDRALALLGTAQHAQDCCANAIREREHCSFGDDRPCWEHRRRALLAEVDLELEPHADPARPRAGGPQAGGQGAEDAPLERGPDHQRAR